MTIQLKVADNNAELRYHYADKKIVIESLYNLDHNLPIALTEDMVTVCTKFLKAHG